MKAYSPRGVPIIGTFEALPGVAAVAENSWRMDSHGGVEFDYAGDTDVWWDDQRTVQNEDGKLVLVDAQNNFWLMSDCQFLEKGAAPSYDATKEPIPNERMGKKIEPGIFTDRELSTVLAALRYWNREGLRSEGAEHQIANNAGSIEPLNSGEIEDLCERLWQ